MINRILLSLSIILLITYSTHSQSIVGFWGVTKVTVGKKTKTPIAKWFQFNKNGTLESGNGWTMNAVGSWTYEKKTNELEYTNDLGVAPPFDLEPFKVNFVKDTMKWKHMEDGMQVEVSLVPIQDMPPATSDLIKGLWILTKAESSNGNELADYDPNGKQFILFRTDMRFRLRNPDGSLTEGFWHTGYHDTTLTLINYDRSTDNQEFTISFENEILIMKSKSKEEAVYYHTRIHSFPE